MPKINVDEAVERFQERMEKNYYPLDRSKNDEEDYASEKEIRDTNAIHDFVGSPLFEYIKKMK